MKRTNHFQGSANFVWTLGKQLKKVDFADHSSSLPTEAIYVTKTSHKNALCVKYMLLRAAKALLKASKHSSQYVLQYPEVHTPPYICRMPFQPRYMIREHLHLPTMFYYIPLL